MKSVEQNNLDLAIMYSDPLIAYNKKNGLPIPCGDPVDFESEINNLKSSLASLRFYLI